MLEKLFKLKEHGTNVKTEAVAGIITFMTMAYILAVNPDILSATGMNRDAILVATALASFVGCIAMALFANYPFALAPGLGLNAYFAYTVCGIMGYSWQFALLAVFVEGIIFIILSLTRFREAIFNAIPMDLKRGVTVGIGLFCAFIGFDNANLVFSGSTIVEMIDFSKDFNTQGISALLCLIGFLIIAILHVRKVKGCILIGIVATWLLGIVCELTGLYVVTPEEGFYSLIPSWSSFNIMSVGEVFGQCFNFSVIDFKWVDLIAIVLSLLFVDIFDTIGTLIGVANNANMLDKDGKLPRIRRVLMADAVATTAGAVIGTSTTTTFVESSSGVVAGGKTGLASVFTGLFFLLSIVFAPVFIAIPGFATAPALIFVGFMMVTTVADIDFKNYSESIPAFFCIICMPFMYSISEGIAAGIISYVIINLFTGKHKKITLLMYILAVLFVLKYAFLK